MNDMLRSKPATIPSPPVLEFEEPAPNRLPFQFLLFALSVPVAIVTGILMMFAKLFGNSR